MASIFVGTVVIAVLLCMATLIVGVVAVMSWLASRSARQPSGSTSRRALNRMHSYNVATGTPRTILPYERIPTLLTDAEQLFYATLLTAIPPITSIFCQVRLANLVQVTTSERRNYAHFNRIQAKCVDFVLCDAHTTAPKLVIELDDSSHQQAQRKARDTFVDAALASAGVPILHARWQPTYDALQLAAQINAAIEHVSGVPAPVRQFAPAAARRMGAAPLPASQNVRFAPPAVVGSNKAFQWACGQCHKQIARFATYCLHCGASLEKGH